MISIAIWDKLAQGTYPRLMMVILKWTRDYELAIDITQAAFEAAIDCPKFDPSRPDAFGFLRQKAWWLWKSHCRRRQFKFLPEDYPDPLANRKWEINAIQEAVHLAVMELPETKREVVNRYLAGMSHSEIAEAMGVPITKVYSLFHQAKANLREVLDPPIFASCR